MISIKRSLGLALFLVLSVQLISASALHSDETIHSESVMSLSDSSAQNSYTAKSSGTVYSVKSENNNSQHCPTHSDSSHCHSCLNCLSAVLTSSSNLIHNIRNNSLFSAFGNQIYSSPILSMFRPPKLA
jgi:hypothetical protein